MDLTQWSQVFDSFWDYTKNQDTTNYTKLLELNVSSNNFFLLQIEESQLSYTIQKKLWKQSIELYKETSQKFIYLSPPYYIEKNNNLIPILLCNLNIEYQKNDQKFNWKISEDLFFINPILDISDSTFSLDTINTNANSIFEELKLTEVKKQNWAIFLSKDPNNAVKKDLIKLYKNQVYSKAMNSLFELKLNNDTNIEPISYADILHVSDIDKSQYSIISKALTQDIILSGPPGTGKSQTILNFCFEEVRNNKKILIVSEKKAALDVLYDRIQKMGLANLVLKLDDSLNFKTSIDKIESNIDFSINFKLEIEHFNQSYYHYCHKTIEQYFDAYYTLKNKSNRTYSELLSLKNKPTDFILKISELVFKSNLNKELLALIYPSNKLIDFTWSEIQKIFIEFLTCYKEVYTEKFNFNGDELIDLTKILELFLSIDSQSLNNWLKSNNSLSNEYTNFQKNIALIEKELKDLELINTYNIENELLLLEAEKLKNFYENYSIFKKLFSKDISLLDTKFKEKFKDWNTFSSLKKIDFLRIIELKIQNSERLDFETKKLNTWLEENKLTLILPTLKYISKKKKDKNITWDFIFSMFGSKYNPNTIDKWTHFLKSTQKVAPLIINFRTKDSNFWKMKFDSIEKTEVNSLDWDFICTNNTISKDYWEEFIYSLTPNETAYQKSEINDFLFHYPILKNYSYREIIQLKRNIQDLEPQYQKYSIRILKKIHSKNLSQILSLAEKKYIKKDSIEYTLKLDLIKQLKFIKKKWSEKKQKIYLQEYLSHLSPEFLLNILPIVIATPNEVSKYIEFKKELFDTVIFDESSQIEFKNAIPSLYRAKKMMIVGDQKQLTPTIFFKSNNTSILFDSLLNISLENIPQERLKYHYRSSFKELIEFSNSHFYNSELIATQKSNKDAIIFDYVPNGIYEDRKNQLEAKRIVYFLKEISLNQPNKSIGVACFSIQQKNEIEFQIELECSKDILFQEFIETKKQETNYFFVKNLENLQGDERDIIIISIGYGKNKNGNLFYYFGPILGFQGENRLNVLASRSKEQMIVVSSLKSSDIRIKDTSKNGLRLFKEFLYWLEFPQKSISILSKPKPVHYLEYFFNPFKTKKY